MLRIVTPTPYNNNRQKAETANLKLYEPPVFQQPASLTQWANQDLTHLKAGDNGPGLHRLQMPKPRLTDSRLADWRSELYKPPIGS